MLRPFQGLPLQKECNRKMFWEGEIKAHTHKQKKKKNTTTTTTKNEITYKLSCYEYLFTFVNFP